MRVVIVGITGRVGRLVAHDLVARGDDVRGIVRRARQRAELAEAGIPSVIGDLAETDVDGFELAIADGMPASASSARCRARRTMPRLSLIHI